MKAKQRKLIPAIAMLLVAAVTLTSASYAWFTMSREVTANGIQLTAKAPTNLLIASGAGTPDGDPKWDGSNHTKYDFSTIVTLTSGTNAGKLIPASTMDGLELWYPTNLTKLDGTFDTAKTTFEKATKGITSGTGADNDGYYVDIPLWIKNAGTETVKVVLKTQAAEQDDTNLTAITATTGEGENLELAKAARFAILNEARGAAITASGKYMYKSSAAEYFTTGPIKTVDTGTKLGTEATQAEEEAIRWASLTDNSENVLFELDGETEKEFIVRVWLEGQDKSCHTDNQKGKINIQLVFADKAQVTPAR